MQRITGMFEKLPRPSRRTLIWVLVVFLLILILYYPVGALWAEKIEDDLSFKPTGADVVEGGSAAVAITTALILRETETHAWVANDPFFKPASILDNMPNFQQGIISSAAVFTFELKDQIGRTRGSSQADTDLQEASGLLQYSGTKWRFDFSTSLWPVSTSEEQYGKARRALLSYNRRLASGGAVFERRADNLMATLDRIALDIGSSSAALDRHIKDQSPGMIDTTADDLFYSVKGQVYAYGMILKGLRRDFAGVIEDRDLGTAWGQMEESLSSVVLLDPMIVANGEPDAQMIPNHLAAQGFFLLRARTQLREITNILLK